MDGLTDAELERIAARVDRQWDVSQDDLEDVIAEIRRLRAELAEAREVAAAVEKLCDRRDGVAVWRERGIWIVRVKHHAGDETCSYSHHTGPTLLAALRAALAAKGGA